MVKEEKKREVEENVDEGKTSNQDTTCRTDTKPKPTEEMNEDKDKGKKQGSRKERPSGNEDEIVIVNTKEPEKIPRRDGEKRRGKNPKIPNLKEPEEPRSER